MNYRHAFHAGNFADVHKHVVLTRILEHLRGKTAPFRVVDSHAGAGRYDLQGPEAARSQEWEDGIARVVAAAGEGRLGDEAAPLLKPYLDAVAAHNAVGTLRFYPGSPLVALSLLRSNDRLIACECEPAALQSLKATLGRERRAKALAIDGWMAVKANVPPKERRGLVLIDPPYEATNEFARLPAALAEAHRKWPTGIYMLWYPVTGRDAPDALARRLRRLGIGKILRSEIAVAPAREDAGLTASGLIVVNPPFPLESELRGLLPRLARVLASDATHRLDWLAGEATPPPIRKALPRRT